MNARRKATRAQILRAAADLFRERGYPASTVDHIAARLGMSKASLYTHFRAKEANLPARFARSLAAQKDRYDKGVERIVAEGTSTGVFRDVPPRLVVFAILGMVNWVHKWYNPRGRWGAEEISAAFLSLIEGGLLRQKPRGRALGGRLRRLERELHEVARQLDA